MSLPVEERLPEFPEHRRAAPAPGGQAATAIGTESNLVGGLIFDALCAPFWLVLLLLGKAQLRSGARPLRRIFGFLLAARMTAVLVGLNLAVFVWEMAALAQGTSETQFMRTFALSPSDLVHGNLAPIPLHVFAHASIGHLAGNMIALMVFGRIVERHLGPWRLLGAYAGAAVVSTVISLGAMVASGQDTPSLGASGAVAGMVALGILLQPFTITYEALLPLPVFVLGWLMAATDLSGILSGRHDGIDHAAHLGGYVSVLVIYIGLTEVQRRKARIGLLMNLGTAAACAALWIFWLSKL